MSSSAAIIPLHLLGGVYSDQIEAAAEHALSGGAKGEAAGANADVFNQDAVDSIELVEARGERFEVGWDGMYLAPLGCVLYDAGEIEELEHEETLFGGEISGGKLVHFLRVNCGPFEDA